MIAADRALLDHLFGLVFSGYSQSNLVVELIIRTMRKESCIFFPDSIIINLLDFMNANIKSPNQLPLLRLLNEMLQHFKTLMSLVFTENLIPQFFYLINMLEASIVQMKESPEFDIELNSFSNYFELMEILQSVFNYGFTNPQTRQILLDNFTQQNCSQLDIILEFNLMQERMADFYQILLFNKEVVPGVEERVGELLLKEIFGVIDQEAQSRQIFYVFLRLYYSFSLYNKNKGRVSPIVEQN